MSELGASELTIVLQVPPPKMNSLAFLATQECIYGVYVLVKFLAIFY